MNVNPEILKQEKNIVWLYDLKDYPWLRESDEHFPERTGITKALVSNLKKYAQEKIVGYAELEDDSKPTAKGRNRFKRRIFVLRNEDYENYKNHFSFPTEAIDPLTVQPKKKGLRPQKT